MKVCQRNFVSVMRKKCHKVFLYQQVEKKKKKSCYVGRTLKKQFNILENIHLISCRESVSMELQPGGDYFKRQETGRDSKLSV